MHITECGCDSNFAIATFCQADRYFEKSKRRMYYRNILFRIPIVGTYHVIMVSFQIDHLMINY